MKTILERRLGVRFADSDVPPAFVTVRSGPYWMSLPSGTVGHLRARFAQRYQLAPRSKAYLAGVEASELTVVQPKQSVRFMNQAGVKG